VDIGGPFWNFEVRVAARRSDAAPRVVVAGPLVSMVDRPKLDLGDPPIIKTTSISEVVDLVRKEIDRKADYIKVWFIHRPGDDLAAQEAMVKAAGDSAHAAGIPLAVHATELATAKASLRAGADYLVHSVEDAAIDDEFIALAKKNNALYCPTLFVTMGYRYMFSNTWQATGIEKRRADPEVLAMMNDLERIPKEAIPERVQALMARPPEVKPSQTMLENLRKVWDAGIPIAMGTDAGNVGTLHGPSVFREMELMTQAGLSPLDVLRAATVGGARAMRMERDLGRIETGRLADLLILDADPTQSIANLSRVHRVVKGGHVYVPDELMRSIR
jgi:imidazolonepropionase-like amidohydrolase